MVTAIVSRAGGQMTGSIFQNGRIKTRDRKGTSVVPPRVLAGMAFGEGDNLDQSYWPPPVPKNVA